MYKNVPLYLVFLWAFVTWGTPMSIWEGTYLNVTNFREIVTKGTLAKTQNATLELTNDYVSFHGYHEGYSIPIVIERADRSVLDVIIYDEESSQIHAYQGDDKVRTFTYKGCEYVHIKDFWGIEVDNYDIYDLSIALFFSRGYWRNGKPFNVEAKVDKKNYSLKWMLNRDGKSVPFEGGRATDFCDEGYMYVDSQRYIFSPSPKSLSLYPVTSVGECDNDTIGIPLKLKKGNNQYKTSGGILFRYPSSFSARWGSVSRGDSIYLIAKTVMSEECDQWQGRWCFVMTNNKYGWINEGHIDTYMHPNNNKLFKSNGHFVNTTRNNRGVYVDDPKEITRPLPPKDSKSLLRTEVDFIDFDKDGSVDPVFVYYYKDSIEVAPLLKVFEKTASPVDTFTFVPQPKVIIAGTHLHTLAVLSWHKEWCNIHIRSYIDSTKLKIPRRQCVTTKDAYTVILGGGSDPLEAHSCLATFNLNPVSQQVRQLGYPKIVVSDTIAGLNPGYTITLAGIYEDRQAADNFAQQIKSAQLGAYVRKIHLPKEERDLSWFSIGSLVIPVEDKK